MRRLLALLICVGLVCVTAGTASAAQGVAVLGMNGAREDAAALARAVYGSGLRPKGVDEFHAHLLWVARNGAKFSFTIFKTFEKHKRELPAGLSVWADSSLQSVAARASGRFGARMIGQDRQ